MATATVRDGTAGYDRTERFERPVPPRSRRRRRWTVALPLAASLAMVPWILGLAASTPDRYVVHHWNVTWVGFDILELVCFAVVSWSAWRRRPAVRTATVVGVTLLACDAWFTMTTISSAADLVTGVVTIAGGLPFAVTLLHLRRSFASHAPVAGV